MIIKSTSHQREQIRHVWTRTLPLKTCTLTMANFSHLTTQILLQNNWDFWNVYKVRRALDLFVASSFILYYFTSLHHSQSWVMGTRHNHTLNCQHVLNNISGQSALEYQLCTWHFLIVVIIVPFVTCYMNLIVLGQASTVYLPVNM